MVRIELFGVPRLVAKTSEIELSAATVGEALAELDRLCPELQVLDGSAPGSPPGAGAIGSGYLVALNGHSFTGDPALALHDGDVLVVLSAQAGG